MAEGRIIVAEAQLRSPAFVGGQSRPMVGTGPTWPGMKVTADSRARELIVDVPNPAAPKGPKHRVRIPYENVVWYRQAVVAPTKPVGTGWAEHPD